MSEIEVARLTALLRDAIKLSKTSNRSVERQLGLSSGYLSRLFAGVMELRVQHILEICTAIGFPPGEFFKAAYPTEDGEQAEKEDPTSAKLRQALERLHPASDLEPPKPAPPAARPSEAKPDGGNSLQEADVEKILLSALRKLLIQSAAPGADAPKRP
ncbi:MAG TPA: helix-turn-helix domain-containing protein [Thermoanaerobaculia bacterium]|jgi:transcriptional regulator with XRE-family HTH domain|nr:helix-turn-helix domain-containing protein [Thermoanaerobaculia bacterium]